ncbi:hypothetical protein [Corynebacterium oculi]|uniref:Secreted protein n=1 Tax=Corynebacterium oculi TaxID=1544416 RepID=A0A0Q1DV94_9CORY|nr:hypothetical protein [Corynebacterium oculi]KQB84093.1 hypothetical protein Cocul_00889 [Corynebacterium oculi]
MFRKAAIAAATFAVAATTAVAPAMAYEVDNGAAAIPDNAPVVEKPAFDLSTIKTDVKPALPGKSHEEQVQQADLTGKRLDNAKKGVETAKTIVDTLGGLGGLFGFGK